MVFYQNDDSVHNLRKMGGIKYWWREMFRAHTKREYKEFFTRGMDGNKDKENRVYPWMYSRVFALCFLLFAIALFTMTVTGYAVSYPTVILLGAIFIDIPLLVLVYELLPKCSLNILQLALVFIIGSVASIVLVEFIGFAYYPDGDSVLEQFCSVLWTGFLEEAVKILPAVIAILILKKHGDPMACFAIGAAVGAGFSIIENMGYIFNNSLEEYISVSQIILVACLRGVTAFGGHTIWAGFEGWAFGKFKRPLINIRFYGMCLLMMFLHCMWDLAIVEKLMYLGVFTTLASFIFSILFTIHVIKKERRTILGNPYAPVQPAAPPQYPPRYYNPYYNPDNPYYPNGAANPYGAVNPNAVRQDTPRNIGDVFSEFSAPVNKEEGVVQEASVNGVSATSAVENGQNTVVPEASTAVQAEENFPGQMTTEQVAEPITDSDALEEIPTVAEEIRQSGGVQLDFASVFGKDAGGVFAQSQSFNSESLFGGNGLNLPDSENITDDKSGRKEEKEELSENAKKRLKYAHAGNVFAVSAGLILAVLGLAFCATQIGIGNETKRFSYEKAYEFVDYLQTGKEFSVYQDRPFDQKDNKYYAYKIENGKYVEITQVEEGYFGSNDVYYVYDVKQPDYGNNFSTSLSYIYVNHNGEKVELKELTYTYTEYSGEQFIDGEETVTFFNVNDGVKEYYYDDVFMEFVIVLDNEIFHGLGALISLSVLGGAALVVGALGYTVNHILARRFKEDEQPENTQQAE